MTWEVLNPGVWVIFFVVGLPVYAAFLGWFLGRPRNIRTTILGTSLFLMLVTALWAGLFATTLLIRVLFFG